MSQPSPDRDLAELLWRRGALPRALLSACLKRAEQSGGGLGALLIAEGHLDLARLRELRSAEEPEARGPGGTLRLDSDAERPAAPARYRAELPPSDTQAADPQRIPGARRRVGPYELLEELGRGGMGAVYRARHLKTGQECALKTLHQGGDAEDQQRFRREADLAWQLEHPGIVRVLDVGSDGPLRYLGLELLSGGSLQTRLARQGPLPIAEVLRIGAALADALQHAHEGGVLHRDLKPANVILDGAGDPKLADFGLAQGPSGHSLTTTGSILGTPAFMAPEQARDSKRVDERTDVYGLGATLYCLLTGRPPVVAGSLHEALAMLESQSPPPLRSLRPAASAELEAVLRCALARDPGDRYASAAALGLALREAGGGGAIPRPRGPLWIGVAALLVCAGLGLGLALASREERSFSPSPAGGELPSPAGEVSPAAPGASAPPPAQDLALAQGPAASERLSSRSEAPLAGGLARLFGGDPWEGVVTWTRLSAQGELGLSAFLRLRPGPEGSRERAVELLRLQAYVFEPGGAPRFDSNPGRGRAGLLPVLLQPLPLADLRVVEGGCLEWAALPGLKVGRSGLELDALIAERLSPRSLVDLWVRSAALEAGAAGTLERRALDSAGLVGAAWREGKTTISVERIRAYRVMAGVFLGKTHPQDWPALVSRNGLEDFNHYKAGELFEEPALPARGGEAATLSVGCVVRARPFGLPIAVLPQQRDVFALEVLGSWRRIQWGASYAYVALEDLRPALVSEGCEVTANKPILARLTPGKADSSGGALEGQRFVLTGRSAEGRLEIYYDHRLLWIEARWLRKL